MVISAKVALRSKTLASPIPLSHQSIADWRIHKAGGVSPNTPCYDYRMTTPMTRILLALVVLATLATEASAQPAPLPMMVMP